MPSANKTPNIGLNNWEGNEYVKRQDFIDDNLIIDEKVGQINEHLGDMTQVPTTSKTASGAITELFTDVSNGKTLVGTAITDVDNSVVVPTNPTFSDLASAIGQINTGKKWASGIFNITNVQKTLTINMLDFTPKIVVVYLTEYSGAFRKYIFLGMKDTSIQNYNSGKVDNMRGYLSAENILLVDTSSNITWRTNGFSITSMGTNEVYKWYAFE